MTTSPRAGALLVAAALTTTWLGVQAPTTAAAAATTPCAAGTPVPSDFDGDGRADLAVGSASYSAQDGTRRAEWVRYTGGSDATWVTDSESLVSADLNGDICADAVLAAGQDTDERYGRLVKVVPGTSTGLDLDAATVVTIPQISDDCLDSEGDCSADLVLTGLRHDGLSQVAAAVTKRNEGDVSRAYLDIFTFDANLTLTHTQIIDPDEERLFSALVSDGATLALGDPWATVNGKPDAGAVHLYTPDSSDPTVMVERRVLTQNSKNVPGTAEAGDGFGATLAMRDGRLAIGVPGEDDGRITDSGAVQPILWNEKKRTYTAYRQINQDTPGVPGTNEKSDRFGDSLAIARGLSASGSYDIAIGAEEAYGKLKWAGSVTVANVTRKLFRTYTQATRGVPGTPETNDYFGASLGVLRATSGADTLLVSIPGDDSVIRTDGKRLTSATTWSSIPLPSDAPSGTYAWGLGFSTNG
ncbi:hypothetical protein [Propionicimonas sp.]|uniref:hypothetical protein n=1 Tax=Propionicimonas sp. TaxID=1955623 RepID=UPI0039E5C9CD